MPNNSFSICTIFLLIVVSQFSTYFLISYTMTQFDETQRSAIEQFFGNVKDAFRKQNISIETINHLMKNEIENSRELSDDSFRNFKDIILSKITNKKEETTTNKHEQKMEEEKESFEGYWNSPFVDQGYGAEPSHMYCNFVYGKWYLTESGMIPKKVKPRNFTNIHFYWRQLKRYSKPQPHQMIISAIRGYVVTQNLRRTNAILWVDRNYDWIENSEKEEWQKLKEFVHVRVYNSSEEAKGTPLEGWVGLNLTSGDAWVDSDIFRLLIAYKYGGMYVDIDTLITRDFSSLFGRQFFPTWGCATKLGENNNVLRLFRESPASKVLLEKVRVSEKQFGRSIIMQTRYTNKFEMRNVSTIPCWFFSFQWDEAQGQCGMGLSYSYFEMSENGKSEIPTDEFLIRKGVGPMCLPSSKWNDVLFGVHYHTNSLWNKPEHEWQIGSKLDLVDKEQEQLFLENYEHFREEKRKFPVGLKFEESHKDDEVDRSERKESETSYLRC